MEDTTRINTEWEMHALPRKVDRNLPFSCYPYQMRHVRTLLASCSCLSLYIQHMWFFHSKMLDC